MSSVIRSKASASYSSYPEPVCLIAYGGIPVPFYYNKRANALDVKFVNGFSASTTVNGDDEDVWTRANLFNGTHLVTQLGSNFKLWIETAYGADAGTVEVHEPGVVIKANQVVPDFEPNSDSSFSNEYTTPFSYESAAGGEDSDYLATVLFKKAMVIKYKKSGTQYYRGFATLWGEGNT